MLCLLTCFLLSGAPPEKEKHLTGIYDLVAVLTHKGRSADSGHYVAWVKQENGWFYMNYFTFLPYSSSHQIVSLYFFATTGKWIQFDDDNPIPQREEDITRLSGGGKLTA